jgi:outer membrane protein assembly factor BamA
MPFEKSYFMGGANDMRGWTAYHFGPGATSEELLRTSGYFAAAPIKFITNAEYRFTMHDAWKGAIFLDAGNMWLYNRSYGNDLTTDQIAAITKGTFRWDSFYKQLGLNTGFGFRYDLEFFIMRADIAMKLHHPGAEGRANWVVQQPEWHDFNLTLGIGYPF